MSFIVFSISLISLFSNEELHPPIIKITKVITDLVEEATKEIAFQ